MYNLYHTVLFYMDFYSFLYCFILFYIFFISNILSTLLVNFTDMTQEFDLKFPSKDIKNYILLDNNVPEMSNMTLMFWINTLQAERMTVLSYAVQESVEELRIFLERDKIMLMIHSLQAL